MTILTSLLLLSIFEMVTFSQLLGPDESGFFISQSQFTLIGDVRYLPSLDIITMSYTQGSAIVALNITELGFSLSSSPLIKMTELICSNWGSAAPYSVSTKLYSPNSYDNVGDSGKLSGCFLEEFEYSQGYSTIGSILTVNNSGHDSLGWAGYYGPTFSNFVLYVEGNIPSMVVPPSKNVLNCNIDPTNTGTPNVTWPKHCPSPSMIYIDHINGTINNNYTILRTWKAFCVGGFVNQSTQYIYIPKSCKPTEFQFSVSSPSIYLRLGSSVWNPSFFNFQRFPYTIRAVGVNVYHIAISFSNCSNNTIFIGIVSGEYSTVTNQNWTCSDIYYPNWDDLTFDDSNWDPATVLSNNGPFRLQNYYLNAHHIWAQYNSSQIYCRLSFLKSNTPTPQPAPILAPLPAPILAPLPAPILAPLPAPILAPLPAPILASQPAPILAPLPAPILDDSPAPDPIPLECSGTPPGTSFTCVGNVWTSPTSITVQESKTWDNNHILVNGDVVVNMCPLVLNNCESSVEGTVDIEYNSSLSLDTSSHLSISGELILNGKLNLPISNPLISINHCLSGQGDLIIDIPSNTTFPQTLYPINYNCTPSQLKTLPNIVVKLNGSTGNCKSYQTNTKPDGLVVFLFVGSDCNKNLLWPPLVGGILAGLVVLVVILGVRRWYVRKKELDEEMTRVKNHITEK